MRALLPFLLLGVVGLPSCRPPEPASLEGRVRYSGDERDRTVTVTRDPEACGPEGSELPEGSLLIGPEGGLANAVVLVEGLSAPPLSEPIEHSLLNTGCLFEPRVLTARVGDRLAVGSEDPALHSTRVRTEGRSLFNLTLPAPGARLVKPLKEPGLHSVDCDAHDWMQAWVWVADHPWLTVTGPDGSFALEGLPAGRHQILIWHERLGERRLEIELPAGGRERLEVSF